MPVSLSVYLIEIDATVIGLQQRLMEGEDRSGEEEREKEGGEVGGGRGDGEEEREERWDNGQEGDKEGLGHTFCLSESGGINRYVVCLF